MTPKRIIHKRKEWKLDFIKVKILYAKDSAKKNKSQATNFMNHVFAEDLYLEYRKNP